MDKKKLDKENLTPGKYYPPDDEVMKIYRQSKK